MKNKDTIYISVNSREISFYRNSPSRYNQLQCFYNGVNDYEIDTSTEKGLNKYKKEIKKYCKDYIKDLIKAGFSAELYFDLRGI